METGNDLKERLERRKEGVTVNSSLDHFRNLKENYRPATQSFELTCSIQPFSHCSVTPLKCTLTLWLFRKLNPYSARWTSQLGYEAIWSPRFSGISLKKLLDLSYNEKGRQQMDKNWNGSLAEQTSLREIMSMGCVAWTRLLPGWAEIQLVTTNGCGSSKFRQ
ncbi:unnamed protein product [Strongylus vulgaris]|uniref:Uncharacterized protein n=1 Tax=Strongylus vulgaris TaxID=40348 RepID=A0A3P7L4Z6_STRVU|nr:unnamed protein product [Strongylus vulgaris]